VKPARARKAKAKTCDRWKKNRTVFACFRVEQLLQSAVFNPIKPQDVLLWSAIIEILIQLRYLCDLASSIGVTLSWSDDIAPCKDYSHITGLIKFFRDGLCHSDTSHSRSIATDKNTLARSVLPEKHSHTISGVELSNPYADDVAIFLGANRIFLFRHIVRAFNELRQSFVKAGIVGPPHWSNLLQ